jgi:predicted nucleotidyltransferase
MPLSSSIESSAPHVRLSVPPHLVWFRKALEAEPDVLAVFLLGSVARGDHDGRSDLDLVVWTRAGASPGISTRLRTSARERFPQQLPFPKKNKVVFYSADATSKVDLFTIEALGEVARYVAGSRINEPEKAVLFDRTSSVTTWMRSIPPEIDDLDLIVPEEIALFVYHFERASALHAMNDMYKARFNLEIALHCVARLEWRSTQRSAFAWLPRDLLKILPDSSAESFREYDAPMDPSMFHAAKLHLLHMFRAVTDRLGRTNESAFAFCQQVLARDRWWNHRDSATFTSDELTRGVLLRGSSPHRYAADPDYHAWLDRNRVEVLIDLRGETEKAESPIRGLPVKAIEAPVDPWKNFAKDDPLKQGVDGSEASYRFTALRCPLALRAVIDAVVEARGAVLVHCFAGVDRTGVIIALAQLLAGVSRDRVLTGYSASSDSRRTGFLARTLTLVDEHGGVEVLATAAGVTPSQLAVFRSRMGK